MRVMLATPPYHCGVVESAGRWPPLALIAVGGPVRDACHDVEIYDAMSLFVGMDEVKARLALRRPDLVGITTITPTAPASLRVLAAAKEVRGDCVTVMGGVHGTFLWREILEAPDSPVDYVVIGEGDHTLRDLVACLESGGDPMTVRGLAFRRDGKAVCTPARPRLASLDPVRPAFDLLDWNLYTYYPRPGSKLAVISTSRGCGYECSFCSQQRFWERSWRGRSPELVMAELEHLKVAHGVDVVLFADEYPSPDRARWEQLLDLLIERDLGQWILLETRVPDIVRDARLMDRYRRAGIIHVYVGVEATDQGTLDRFQKRIRIDESREAIRLINGAGMVSETSMVLGMPEDTNESIERTLELALEYDPDFAHFLLIAPWPYAGLHRELSPYIETTDYAEYNLVSPVARTKAMSRDQLMKKVVDCYRRFYMAKLPRWFALPEGFKKTYLFDSMRQIVKSSFLRTYMGGLGQIPAEVEKFFRPAAKKSRCPVRGLFGVLLAGVLALAGPGWSANGESNGNGNGNGATNGNGNGNGRRNGNGGYVNGRNGNGKVRIAAAIRGAYEQVRYSAGGETRTRSFWMTGASTDLSGPLLTPALGRANLVGTYESGANLTEAVSGGAAAHRRAGVSMTATLLPDDIRKYVAINPTLSQSENRTGWGDAATYTDRVFGGQLGLNLPGLPSVDTSYSRLARRDGGVGGEYNRDTVRMNQRATYGRGHLRAEADRSTNVSTAPGGAPLNEDMSLRSSVRYELPTIASGPLRSVFGNVGYIGDSSGYAGVASAPRRTLTGQLSMASAVAKRSGWDLSAAASGSASFDLMQEQGAGVTEVSGNAQRWFGATSVDNRVRWQNAPGGGYANSVSDRVVLQTRSARRGLGYYAMPEGAMRWGGRAGAGWRSDLVHGGDWRPARWADLTLRQSFGYEPASRVRGAAQVHGGEAGLTTRAFNMIETRTAYTLTDSLLAGDRSRAGTFSISADVTPLEGVTVSGGWSRLTDRRLGTTDTVTRSDTANGELRYAPRPAVSVSGRLFTTWGPGREARLDGTARLDWRIGRTIAGAEWESKALGAPTAWRRIVLSVTRTL